MTIPLPLPTDGALAALPGRAPVALSNENVNFASQGQDSDAACTGTFTAPTAPPGKVCVYLAFTPVGIDLPRSVGVTTVLADRAFGILLFAEDDDDQPVSIVASWAYTAP